ncbi:methylmalonyl-CoA epimerase [Halapricum salinum]|uniref:Methylmalonyl-CoA epimerase n=1 Tax=Halapricum salinum TaxID=1457250 RepID=A0A4D6HFL4_9EURY|nr:methylmalonyl-CoA epimerase [Halapricum salinum]QCC52580.1 methylmalonyl-CoA epimerase [Halapricum salinum]
MRFDHAGIATEDAAVLAERYESLLDAEIAHQETFDGMEIVFLDLGNGYFELLEPVAENNAIARYLDRRGSGIHHLALATVDIEQALARAERMGIESLDDEPRPGAWGHDVAFLHPRDTGGVLLEFVSTN